MTKKAALLVACCLQAGVLLGLFIPGGQALDKKFQTSGLLTLLVVVVIMGVWFYQVMRLMHSPGRGKKPLKKKKTVP